MNEVSKMEERMAIWIAVVTFGFVLVLRVMGVGLWSHDAGGVEGSVIHGIQKMLLDRPLYEDPERPTYDVMLYAPGYYWIAFAIGNLISIDPLEPRTVFMLSRVLSMLLNLASLIIFHRLLRSRGTHQAMALFLTALMCVSMTRHFFSRPDSLSLLFFMLAMGATLRYVEARHEVEARRSLWWVLLWGIMAIWAKQSAVLAIGLTGLHALMNKRWRDVLFLTIGSSLLIAMSIAILVLIYNTGPLYQNMITGLRNGYSLDMYKLVFLTPNYLFMIGIHIVGAWLCARGFRSVRSVERFLAMAIPTTFLFGLLTGLKSGGRLNYFIENFTCIYLALGVFTRPANAMRLARVWPSVVLFVGTLFISLRARELRAQLNWTDPLVSDRSRYEEASAVNRYLRADQHLGPDELVYTTEIGFVEHFLTGHSVLNQKDVIHYSDSRLYDYSDLLNAFTDGRIRFVVSRLPRTEVYVLGERFTNYRPLTTIGRLHVLEFRGANTP